MDLLEQLSEPTESISYEKLGKSVIHVQKEQVSKWLLQETLTMRLLMMIVYLSFQSLSVNFITRLKWALMAISLLKQYIQKSKFHDLTYSWGEWVGKGYQNEENFEICVFQIAKITNVGQQLGQSIYFHSWYTK